MVARQAGLGPTTIVPLVVTPQQCVLRVECGNGTTLVAKGAFRDRLRPEVAAHRWAVQRGLPVAPLVEANPGPPEVMLTEWLPGPTLDRVEDPAAWHQAGALLRQLHDAPRPWPEHLEPHPETGEGWQAGVAAQVARAAEDGSLSPRLAQFVSDVVAAEGPTVSALTRLAIVHGDCMPAHLIRGHDRQFRLIDLEYLRIDDPAWDLAVLCAFESSRLDDVLAGYDPAPEEERRLRRLVPARRIERLVRALNWCTDHAQPHLPVLRVLVPHLRAFGVDEPGLSEAGSLGALSR
ncbi:MAG: aminoglycoside phosphotransferase family protein [Acidimicrobiales bacterium]|nr:aminoglycoside phosphotransferase family protein [Acidimicrobiales bacterium]